MSSPAWHGSSAPARVCLAGEDLDWLNGGAIQVAIDKRLTYRSSWEPQPRSLVISSLGALNVVSEVPDVWSVASDSWANMCASLTAAHVGRFGNQMPTRIEIFSEIPPASGLASSAALAASIASALTRGLSERALIGYCAYLERSVLGRSVGPMDFLPCILGGLTWCECSENQLVGYEQLSWPEQARFVIVNTQEQRDTSQVIRWKQSRIASGDARMRSYVAATRRIVSEMRCALEESRVDLAYIGNLISRAHYSMRDDLTVSTPLIEEVVSAVIDAGALGAKITGTGRGGCVFALVYADAIADVLNSVEHLPVHAFTAGCSVSGVQLQH